MDDWENEAKIIKDAAWVKGATILEDVQDDWDAESESDTEQKDANKASPQKLEEGHERQDQKLTKREQRRLESASKDDTDMIFEQNRPPYVDDEVGVERKIRLADLQLGMELMGVKGTDELKNEVVEASLIKRTASNNAPSTASQRTLATTKDVDDLVKHILTRELSPHSTTKLYPVLLETLFREVSNTREVPELRRLASIVSEIAATKQKAVVKKKPQIELGGKKGSKYDVEEYGDDPTDEYD